MAAAGNVWPGCLIFMDKIARTVSSARGGMTMASGLCVMTVTLGLYIMTVTLGC